MKVSEALDTLSKDTMKLRHRNVLAFQFTGITPSADYLALSLAVQESNSKMNKWTHRYT